MVTASTRVTSILNNTAKESLTEKIKWKSNTQTKKTDHKKIFIKHILQKPLTPQEEDKQYNQI